MVWRWTSSGPSGTSRAATVRVESPADGVDHQPVLLGVLGRLEEGGGQRAAGVVEPVGGARPAAGCGRGRRSARPAARDWPRRTGRPGSGGRRPCSSVRGRAIAAAVRRRPTPWSSRDVDGPGEHDLDHVAAVDGVDGGGHARPRTRRPGARDHPGHGGPLAATVGAVAAAVTAQRGPRSLGREYSTPGRRRRPRSPTRCRRVRGRTGLRGRRARPGRPVEGEGAEGQRRRRAPVVPTEPVVAGDARPAAERPGRRRSPSARPPGSSMVQRGSEPDQDAAARRPPGSPSSPARANGSRGAPGGSGTRRPVGGRPVARRRERSGPGRGRSRSRAPAPGGGDELAQATRQGAAVDGREPGLDQQGPQLVGGRQVGGRLRAGTGRRTGPTAGRR